MSGRREAPIYADALRVVGWLVQHVDAGSPLGARIHAVALRLVEEVTVALGSRLPEEPAMRADEDLMRLRVLLRLALDVGLLAEAGFLHVSRELDLVGRQLGGWLRRMGEPR